MTEKSVTYRFLMTLLLTHESVIGCHWVCISLFAVGEILLVGNHDAVAGFHDGGTEIIVS